jgi:hypothetical protein
MSAIALNLHRNGMGVGCGFWVLRHGGSGLAHHHCTESRRSSNETKSRIHDINSVLVDGEFD